MRVKIKQESTTISNKMMLTTLLISTVSISFCRAIPTFIKQPAPVTYALIGGSTKINCEVEGTELIPLWLINSTAYDPLVALPSGAVNIIDGLQISPVSMKWNNTSFKCYLDIAINVPPFIKKLESIIGYLYVDNYEDTSNMITSSLTNYSQNTPTSYLIATNSLTSYSSYLTFSSVFQQENSQKLSSDALYPTLTLTSPEIPSYGFSMLPSSYIMTGNSFSSSETAYSNYSNDDSNEYMSQITSLMSEDLQTSILASNNYQPGQPADDGYHLKIIYASITTFAGLMILLCSVILVVISVLRCQKVKKDNEPEYNETENAAYGVIGQIQIEVQVTSTSRHWQPNYVNIQYPQ